MANRAYLVTFMTLFLTTRYYPILGEMKKTRLISTTLNTDLIGIRLAILRFSSALNKPEKMAYNTSGWTHVALIKQTIPYSPRPLGRCSAGTVMPLNATSTYQMYPSATV